MNQLSIPRGDRGSVIKTGALAKIDQFLSKSLSRHPKATCRVAHDGRHIYLRFDVRDRWMQCLRRPFQGRVWQDSCVEFFVHPKPNKGYFNFEINCVGQMLMYYIADWRRDENKHFLKSTKLSKSDYAELEIATSIKAPIPRVLATPLHWWVEATVPLAVLEPHVGKLGDLGGQTWRANFQKCGGDPKHTHWATWNPIGDKVNFHQPDKFGTLVFR